MRCMPLQRFIIRNIVLGVVKKSGLWREIESYERKKDNGVLRI